MRDVIILALISAYFLTGSLATQASLGDTLQQCIAKYGAPVAQTGNSQSGDYAFRNGSFAIAEQIFQGIVFKETVCKPDGPPMSDDEKEAILQANRGSEAWTLSKPRYWIRSDGARAGFFPGSRPRSGTMVLGFPQR